MGLCPPLGGKGATGCVGLATRGALVALKLLTYKDFSFCVHSLSGPALPRSKFRATIRS